LFAAGDPRFRRGRCQLVPLLRMSGHWLEQCGFGIGALVSVTAKQGRIVLTIFLPAPAAMQQVSSRAAAARAGRDGSGDERANEQP